MKKSSSEWVNEWHYEWLKACMNKYTNGEYAVMIGSCISVG